MNTFNQIKDENRRAFIKGMGYYASLGLTFSTLLGGCKPINEHSMVTPLNLTPAEWQHLHRCIELATEALEAGDEPFGSVLVAADGTVLAEDRNRVVSSGDRTRHPEFELARWAAANMTAEERAAATVFTSGEHCPMCAAAHGWVRLGRIVYVSSSDQLMTWLAELGVPPSPVRSLSIREIVPDLLVESPVPDLAEQVHELHRRFHRSSQEARPQI
ncbi:nucleoside deaminase [Nitrosomonas sp. Nm33]|uniref:nucleoside deaminase n=1 Tax=Nitrosomonas sp. Nm33 TaxID=133724 RepID=UPI0008977CEC|nr:nucleoside deaminase [Nitrosomonas sp. Nm33]SDY88281.1 Cytidine and deoxycytidylate deaminase zinc-binding region [Nitrosomonas sp. Nm33]